MLKSRPLTLTLAAMAFAASGTAMAGASPNPAPMKAEASACCSAAMEQDDATPVARADDFEYIGGDAGWQLRAPKYVFQGGGLAHAEDCPVRVASAPTAPALRLLEPSPGA